MTLRTRIEKLEEAAPKEGGRVVALWRSLVRRDEEGRLVESVHSAHVLAGPQGPAESLERDRGRGEHANRFLARVRDAARRIHGRTDAAFEAAIARRPDPASHRAERPPAHRSVPMDFEQIIQALLRAHAAGDLREAARLAALARAAVPAPRPSAVPGSSGASPPASPAPSSTAPQPSTASHLDAVLESVPAETERAGPRLRPAWPPRWSAGAVRLRPPRRPPCYLPRRPPPPRAPRRPLQSFALGSSG